MKKILLYLFLPVAFSMVGCVHERHDDTSASGLRSGDKLTLDLSLPRTSIPRAATTRAIMARSEDDNAIENLFLAFFDKDDDPAGELFVAMIAVPGSEVTTDGDDFSLKGVTVALPAATDLLNKDYTVVVMANCYSAEATALLAAYTELAAATTEPEIETAQDDIADLLEAYDGQTPATFTFNRKVEMTASASGSALSATVGSTNFWNADPADAPDYRPFPMAGYFDTDGSDRVSVKLYRALAKIDVVASAVAAKFTLMGLAVKNHATEGLLLPARVWAATASSTPASPFVPGHLNASTTPFGSSATTSWAAYGASVVDNNNIIDEVFVFESPAKAASVYPGLVDDPAGTAWQDATALYLLGKVAALDDEPRWFRVHLRATDGEVHKHVNILRNHRYILTLTGLTGFGYATLEEAMANKPEGLTTELVAANEMNHIVYNGSYQLSTDKAVVEIPADGSAQPLVVFSDFSDDGTWTIDTSAPDFPDWVTIDTVTGDCLDDGPTTISVSATRWWNMSEIRNAVIVIRSGSLRLEVEVVQLQSDEQAPEEGVQIGNFIWATANVAALQTFAAQETDWGYLYQYGLGNVGWNTDAGPGGTAVSEPDAGATFHTATRTDVEQWNMETENPCPAGWIVPSFAHFQDLFDNDVAYDPELSAYVITDKEEPSRRIVLPLAFHEIGSAAANISWSTVCSYNSRTPDESQTTHFLTLVLSPNNLFAYPEFNYDPGSIRCVKDSPKRGTLTLEVDDEAHGTVIATTSVNGNPGKTGMTITGLPFGEFVMLSARSKPGFSFDRWEIVDGEVPGGTWTYYETQSVTVLWASDEDMTIRANYVPLNSTDPGVQIGSHIWATRNVDAPGYFAPRPESFGLLYQLNRGTVGWSANNLGEAWSTPDTGMPFDNTSYTRTPWDMTPPNNPCPAGWTVPTDAHYKDLMDSTTPSYTFIEDSNGNQVHGNWFTDNITGNKIFSPAVGRREKAYNDTDVMNGIVQGRASSSSRRREARAGRRNFSRTTAPTAPNMPPRFVV